MHGIPNFDLAMKLHWQMDWYRRTVKAHDASKNRERLSESEPWTALVNNGGSWWVVGRRAFLEASFR